MKYSNNNKLCEAFASSFRKSTDEGKANNMFFENDVIYSYGHHFPIARIYRITGIAKFTTRKYSVTTAKHKSIARRHLLSSGYKLLEVENVLD